MFTNSKSYDLCQLFVGRKIGRLLYPFFTAFATLNLSSKAFKSKFGGTPIITASFEKTFEHHTPP